MIAKPVQPARLPVSRIAHLHSKLLIRIPERRVSAEALSFGDMISQ